jgi:serine/threonine-protein kinase RsbW
MPESSWIWSCEHCLPNNYEAGRAVWVEMFAQLEEVGWQKKDIFGLHLAFEEALVNAIKHGNGGDPEKRVRLHCYISDKQVRIIISDEGPGFDYTDLPDPTDSAHRQEPHGRGVLLMRKFMDRVEFNARGNRVTLEKNRPIGL